MILFGNNVLPRLSARLLVPPIVASILALGVFAAFKLLRPQAAERAGQTVAAGGIVTVGVDRTLSSQRERAGDEFKASVLSLQTPDGRPIPIGGAWVVGRCVAVRAKQDHSHPGYMRLALEDLHDSKGRVSTLITTAVSHWGSRDTHRRESRPLGPRPITDPSRLQAETQSSLAGEAELTPDTPVSFVLLEPMVVSR